MNPTGGFRAARRVLLPALALAPAVLPARPLPAFQRPGVNIALEAPAAVHPAPNLRSCRDPFDVLQLTEGDEAREADGVFWEDIRSVGWSFASWIRVRLDLGAPRPIMGFSFRSAAGRDEVAWPDAIHLFVSDDGERWWYHGDGLAACLAQNGPPPDDGYAVHRFWTDRLRLHGRHLVFLVIPGGYHTVCDEIEVCRGPEALFHEPRPGRPVKGLDRAVSAFWQKTSLDRQWTALAGQVAVLPELPRRAVTPVLEAARVEFGDLQGSAPGERVTVPYGEAHRRLFRAQAALWQARGLPGFSAWAIDRWHPFKVTDPPPAPPPSAAVEVRLLDGEVRGAAFAAANAGPHDRKVTLRLRGLPGGPHPEWLTVHEVAWTPARYAGVVAAALPEAEKNDHGWRIDIPLGMTRQVWFTIDSGPLDPGRHHGTAVLCADGEVLAEVPLTIEVSEVAMPDEPRLLVGGWDYTDGPIRDLTPDNLEATARFLARHGVNVPWATGKTMPFGEHDETGRMTAPPDTTRFAAWLNRWPDAALYAVSLGAVFEVSTPAQRRKTKAWIRFWTGWLAGQGIDPARLLIKLVDETRTAGMDTRTIRLARAIKAAAPDVKVFVNPLWPEPDDIHPEVLELADILSPNRVNWIEQREAYQQVYLPEKRKPGKQLAFYSCSGAVREMDPYSYHLLQAWEAFRYGGTISQFWSFADCGGGWSWNEHLTSGRSYTPQFLGPHGCVTSKHMEAIRESRYDFELLSLLRDAVETGRGDPATLDTARKLLADGPARVLDAPGCRLTLWFTPKDRSQAEAVRREAIQLLEQLQ